MTVQSSQFPQKLSQEIVRKITCSLRRHIVIILCILCFNCDTLTLAKSSKFGEHGWEKVQDQNREAF